MIRFNCLKILLSEIDLKKTVTLTTFRGNGVEWAYLRGNDLNFYGFNMGVCASVAAGVAAARPELKVIAIETDGSFLLEVGLLATLAGMKLKNLTVLVFDNQSYGPYGATATKETSLESVGNSFGIQSRTVRTEDEFRDGVHSALISNTTNLLVAKVENHTEEVGGPYKDRNGRIIKEDFVRSMKELLGDKYLTSPTTFMSY